MRAEEEGWRRERLEREREEERWKRNKDGKEIKMEKK